MAENLVHNTGSWITEHPYASAGIAVGTVLILWYLMSGSGAPAAQTSSNSTTDAAGIIAAQIAANASTALGAQQAQVTDNQTAAAQTVALASIQGQTDAAVAAATAASQTAQYNASAEIANSNASVVNTMTNASAAEQLSNNATLQSEFSSLADTLKSFFGGANPAFANVASQSAGTPAGQQQYSPASYLYAALGGPWVPIPYGTPTVAVPATATPVENPNLAPSLQSFLAGFGNLLAGMGKGIQAPVTTSMSETGILSLATINASAVNGWANHA